MDLHLLPDDYAICKIDTPPDLPLPRVAPELYCLTVTDQETSIVCPEAFAPKGGAHELGFRAFRIAGKLPFAAVGILAKLSGALAEAEVPLFAVSTYITDYLLVHHTHLETARRAFKQAGCRVLPVEEVQARVQIIAGKHRGRKLEVPPGRDIRPTSGRVREAIFNVLMHAERLSDGSPRLAGQWVADLCCGSGAMGLEALSRGAVHAVFVDRERVSLQLARTAAERFGETANGHFLRAEATALPVALMPCSVVFVDPPYGKALLPGILKSALEKGWLAEEGWIVAELSGREAFELPETLGLEIHSDRDYGNSRVLFLRRISPSS